MKKSMALIKNILGLGLLAGMMCSCEEEGTTLFDQEAGVHFTISAYSYSFKEKIGVEKDTIKIPVAIYGQFTDTDREVKVSVVEGDTAHVNTIQPERYRILQSIVPKNSADGTVLIELNYGQEMEDSVYVFHLGIEPNEAFQQIDFKKKIVKISVTAQDIKPANWDGCLATYFGDYSTRWWNFIKEATQRTSLPYWEYHNPDPDLWTMTSAEFYANVAVVSTALRKYNESPDGPLVHDDGPSKGKPVEMRK